MNYTIVVAPDAADRIAEYGKFIAENSGSVEIAQRWVNLVYAAIESLDIFPRRFELAEEDAHRNYEIRRLVIGSYVAIYTVDDLAQAVKIIGFRHGARLPRPDTLPGI